ncbi:MAG: DL-endopeptidase inhibitor IseA family protein [Ruminiclostridium sp.]
MKKKLLALLLLGAVILSSACGKAETAQTTVSEQTTASTEATEETTTAATTEEAPETTTTEATTTAEETAETTTAPAVELPVLADYEGIGEVYTGELTLDFLTGQQAEIFNRAYKIAMAYGMATDIFGFPRGEMDENYYYSTGLSFDSFVDYLKSAYTDDSVTAFLNNTSVKNVEGEVYWMDGARGSDISYSGVSFELIEQSEESIKFKAVAEYKDQFDENSEATYEEIPFEMVSTDNGWRMNGFTLWF